jgi:hypothetical protein
MLSAQPMDHARSAAEQRDCPRWRLLWNDAALAALAPAGRRAPAIAGADGLADKGLPTDELFERVRTVARGGARGRPNGECESH